MYNVPTDAIVSGVLYKVIGEKSAIYNGITYITTDTFRGIRGVTTFAYVGTGTASICEITEFYGGAITFEQTTEDRGFPFEETGLEGMAIIFELNEAEKVVQETTEIKGMTIGLEDFPFYNFQITETRYL